MFLGRAPLVTPQQVASARKHPNRDINGSVYVYVYVYVQLQRIILPVHTDKSFTRLTIRAMDLAVDHSTLVLRPTVLTAPILVQAADHTHDAREISDVLLFARLAGNLVAGKAGKLARHSSSPFICMSISIEHT